MLLDVILINNFSYWLYPFYNDIDYTPHEFDPFESPPPVHIIYPRPSYNKACSKLSRNYNQVINASLIATSLIVYFSLSHIIL